MYRRLIVAAFVPFAVFALASPASAHCTFDLDREETVAGGEFYGIGSDYTQGELVEIHWKNVDGPMLARFTVVGNGFRTQLHAPKDAEPGLHIVWAVTLTQETQNFSSRVDRDNDRNYSLYKGINVIDPAAAPPVAERQAPPVSPPGAHIPISRPLPQPQPQEAPAPQPAYAAVPVPVTAPQAQLQAQMQPQLQFQPDRGVSWSRVRQHVPVPADRGHSPATEGLAAAMLALAGTQASSGGMPLALAAGAAIVLATRRRAPRVSELV